jgi:hypothetical protein
MAQWIGVSNTERDSGVVEKVGERFVQLGHFCGAYTVKPCGYLHAWCLVFYLLSLCLVVSSAALVTDALQT